MEATEFAAWIAGISGVTALCLQGYRLFSDRKKERREITTALDRQPQVKQQLELGNLGEAIKHLNAIITSQNSHIASQDARIRHLENRNAALEAEVAAYEDKTDNQTKILEQQAKQLDRCAGSVAWLTEELSKYKKGRTSHD